MSAGQIHHIEIYVSDLTRSRQFWGWFLPLLGYEVYQEWPKGISYMLGATYVVLVQTAERFLDVPYHRCRTGLNHLAFHAESRAQVDEIAESLRRRGVSILYEDRHPFAGGNYGMFFEDPDRIKVELVVAE